MNPPELSKTILVLAPTENDSRIAVNVLHEAGFRAQSVPTLDSLCRAIECPVGALLLAEESLAGDQLARLQGLLERQPSWSDLPILLMSGVYTTTASEIFASSGNISILERPFSRLTLIRSIDVALRAREKQYQVRDLIDQQLRATQARDEFFAALSHELRTPLNVILGWLETLRFGTLSPTSTAHALEILERNARVQKGLIDDLLDVSRIITSKMHFEFNNLDMGHLLQSVVRGFIPRAEEKGISLKLTDCPSGFVVCGDEQRLTQAFSNLITNAIKFTNARGVIQVDLRTEGENHILTVQDDGNGIDPSFLPFVFERLKQEDMSYTRSHGGLGLGLAITSHVISAHHGSIEAFSAGRGQGTKITVALPTAKPGLIAPDAPIASLDMAALRGLRVLAIDDSPDILQLIELWLGRAEAEVKLVERPKEALMLLESYKPDVIVSDIGMPEMDGYQLISAIRARPAEKGGSIPAIALTAYARDEERTRALSAGFQMHISKPISSRELLAAVASLNSDQRLRRES